MTGEVSFRIIDLVCQTLESPLDRKPVNPKGNQPLTFIRRTDAEASKLWPPESTHWKRPSWWERLRAGEEEGGRG